MTQRWEHKRLHDLAPRQRQIARLVADGRTNAEIATALGVSEKTVRNAMYEIYQRLGPPGNRVALVMWVLRQPDDDRSAA